jgi:pimeloyl-ACP methyl ester carboxylesterase
MPFLRKAIKWMGFAALGLVGLLSMVLLIAFVTELVAEFRNRRLYPPPGRMVDTGNGRQQIFCEGSGTPTVVLITGNGVPAILVRPLQDHVAKFSRVCSYDRAGLGWSEPAVHPRNFLGQTDELRTILAAIGENGPLVLAAHSYGGLIARRYYKESPDAIAGMVLIDSAEEGEVFQQGAADGMAASVSENKRSERLARFGVLRGLVTLNPSAASYSSHLTDTQRREANALILRPSFYQGAVSEIVHGFENIPQSLQKPGGLGTLGALPLIVIRHGVPFTGPDMAREEGWTKAQARLAALSSDSRVIVATRNGHDIPTDNPDLVSSAIHDVIRAVREHRTLN